MAISRKQRLMHASVLEKTSIGGGHLTRSEAFHIVGDELGERAGTVAAAFWRVERATPRDLMAALKASMEGAGGPAVTAPDSDGEQMTLGDGA